MQAASSAGLTTYKTSTALHLTLIISTVRLIASFETIFVVNLA